VVKLIAGKKSHYSLQYIYCSEFEVNLYDFLQVYTKLLKLYCFSKWLKQKLSGQLNFNYYNKLTLKYLFENTFIKLFNSKFYTVFFYMIQTFLNIWDIAKSNEKKLSSLRNCMPLLCFTYFRVYVEKNLM
jgi:hypothetical protein